MEINPATYALITGGSKGIGKAIAIELAKRKKNILIVALEDELIHKTSKELRENYPIKVDYLGIDLTDINAPVQILEWLQSKAYRIDILVNNAGFGSSGLLETKGLDFYYKMMDLNNKAAVGITHQLLPELKKEASARILFSSSMEATMPLPYKAVYTATKNFLYAFGLSLREELKDTNVKVTVLCPGPTITNEGGLDRIQSQGSKAKVLVMMPDEVARAAVKALMQGRNVIIPGWMPWSIVKLLSWFPTGLKMSILERVFRQYKYMKAADLE